MAKCRRCPTVLEGRRQLCDSCKAQRPGTAETVAHRKKKQSASTAPPVDQAETPAPIDTPPGLHRRGKLLWQDLGCKVGTAVGELALEICRSADRLDELDRVVAGKGVLQLMQFRLDDIDWDGAGDQHVHIKVSIQGVLTEARLQQATFKELVKEFRAIQSITAPGKSGGGAPAPAAPPATGLDEFSQRRAGRRVKKT
jgi:hypothetical protein